ncbi:hypothetical protein OLZ32_22105 [Rhizobium sp. 1AS11]|uniref:hypothetical protein n=1 Tax=Rhizobium acaciae TaxID=2989736 RepID=UPI002222B714|nr:hypothetical protein [Rhizobium acaciae]MCW1411072.1 hypothetical protein [Rhizobium acaciae]MCW1743076.1 hypothetical protein [Rhizobium acaciae]
MRVAAYQDRLRAFEHSNKIRIPISVLSRIYPRPLDHGLPDLIESNVQYLSHLYGDREVFDFFPTMIFTRPTEHTWGPVQLERIRTEDPDG